MQLPRPAVPVLVAGALIAAGCGGGGGGTTPSGKAAGTTTTTTTPTKIAGRSGLSLHAIGEFDYPVYVENAPGAKDLLFVVEKTGRIQVLSNGEKQSQPFLDIHDRVIATGGEQGLFSVAFDPGYAQNGRFYVHYTNTEGNVEIDEFRRSESSPLLADAASRRTVLLVNHQQAERHNGGQLLFDRDGHLYIGIGDGGTPRDPENDAQSKQDLLGKILRIDPKPDGGYRVPRSNPFVGKPGRDEIFAFGLRNPWRFSFDGRTVWVADVGEDTWEEIDRVSLAEANGANFGWNLFEGPKPCGPCGHKGAKPPPRYVPPVHWYPHAGTTGEFGVVIVGGYVVRDPGLPSLDGSYIYTDNVVGQLRAFDPRTDESRKLGLKVFSPTSFGEGVNGHIYVGTLQSPGPVYRLTQER